MQNYDVYPTPHKKLNNPATWKGIDLANKPEKWITTLTDQGIKELETAAKSFLKLNKDIGEITQTDFPLPSLESTFNQLKQTLIKGIGFGVLRGLPQVQAQKTQKHVSIKHPNVKLFIQIQLMLWDYCV